MKIKEVNEMSDPNRPQVGDAVIYTDEVSVEHDALVTAYHGGDQPNMSINCVYVSSDPEKRDPYGNQLERAASVMRESEYSAHGRFWKPKS
jgi:hypothetical protein